MWVGDLFGIDLGSFRDRSTGGLGFWAVLAQVGFRILLGSCTGDLRSFEDFFQMFRGSGSESDPKTIRKRSEDDPKTIRRRSEDEPKLVRKRFENDPHKWRENWDRIRK